MSDQPSVIRFDEYDTSSTELLGGKVSGLVEMFRSGLHVPPGFAVTTAAQERLFREPVARDALEKAAYAVGCDMAVDRPTSNLRLAACATTEGEALCRQIEDAYAALAERRGVEDPPVAVRSSGQVEDSAEASFAGQFDTYLWITGAKSVVDHVLKVWAGSLAGHTLAYRADRSLGPGVSPMCVGVQLMVEASTAGVMFTLDPLTGDCSQVVLEGSWGLGEAVVRGDVAPDRWSVSKVTGSVTAQELGHKDHEYRFDAECGGVKPMPVEEVRRGEMCLSAGQVTELVELGKRVEALRGSPQDIEWSIDDNNQLYLLQVRPETVWSGRVSESRTAATTETSAVASVISQFARGAR